MISRFHRGSCIKASRRCCFLNIRAKTARLPWPCGCDDSRSPESNTIILDTSSFSNYSSISSFIASTFSEIDYCDVLILGNIILHGCCLWEAQAELRRQSGDSFLRAITFHTLVSRRFRLMMLVCGKGMSLPTFRYKGSPFHALRLGPNLISQLVISWSLQSTTMCLILKCMPVKTRDEPRLLPILDNLFEHRKIPVCQVYIGNTPRQHGHHLRIINFFFCRR